MPNDRLHMAFRLPVESRTGRREFLACSIALDCLAGLSFSPLEQQLVRTEGSANHVEATAMGFVDGVSLGLIVADIADGASMDGVEEAICVALETFAEHGPSEAEMAAVLAQTERAWLSALAAKDERADVISHYALLHDDPGYINTFLDEVATITADEVRTAAARWLRPGARAVVAYRAPERTEAAA